MINKHKSNKIKENSNTVRHLNNGTDHRHSKSCCDQSSPARRTISVYIVYIDYVISFMNWSSFSNLSYPFYYAHSCIWLMKSQSCLWSRPSSRAHERLNVITIADVNMWISILVVGMTSRGPQTKGRHIYLGWQQQIEQRLPPQTNKAPR